MKKIILSLVLLTIISSAGFAAQTGIDENVAVRVLIGEAANQGKRGMICVAEVLRRRGSTKGFYGINGKHIDKQPAWVWKMARAAWAESAHTNYTNGATNFENIAAFGEPYWAKNCVETAKHKDHVFYKCN